MEAAEQDRTDLGLSPELSIEELIELRRLARSRREMVEEPSGPPALPQQRSAAMEWVRRECGWDSPSRSPLLSAPCSRCGAGVSRWCRVRGRESSGKICAERSKKG